MLMQQLIDVLTTNAKKYRDNMLSTGILPILSGLRIHSEIARAVIEPFLSECSKDLPSDIVAFLERRKEEWLPDSYESIMRNTHMNNAAGKQFVDQDVTDAFLVSFINYASLPVDLGLYTSDLY